MILAAVGAIVGAMEVVVFEALKGMVPGERRTFEGKALAVSVRYTGKAYRCALETGRRTVGFQGSAAALTGFLAARGVVL